MSKYLNVLITCICINIMLTLGGYINPSDSVQQGNFLSGFYTLSSNTINENTGATINSDFQSQIANMPQSGGGTTTGLGFIDGIKLFLNLFGFLIASFSAPLQLLFNPNLGLPFVFKMMVALPYTIIYIFSLIGWLRGNE